MLKHGSKCFPRASPHLSLNEFELSSKKNDGAPSELALELRMESNLNGEGKPSSLGSFTGREATPGTRLGLSFQTWKGSPTIR